MDDAPLRRLVDFTTFAALGALSTTQELARAVLVRVEEADPELVAEESLCLVATATARAAQVGWRAAPEAAQGAARAVVPGLQALPFTYRDYLIGGAMLDAEDASLAEAAEHVYQRLARKQEFYGAHLPEGQFPGQHVLRDAMELWMGRISPPGLPEPPQERLRKLELVPRLLTHVKLVLAAARRHGEEGG